MSFMKYISFIQIYYNIQKMSMPFRKQAKKKAELHFLAAPPCSSVTF